MPGGSRSCLGLHDGIFLTLFYTNMTRSGMDSTWSDFLLVHVLPGVFLRGLQVGIILEAQGLASKRW